MRAELALWPLYVPDLYIQRVTWQQSNCALHG
jgi:hypothetical protein